MGSYCWALECKQFHPMTTDRGWQPVRFLEPAGPRQTERAARSVRKLHSVEFGRQIGLSIVLEHPTDLSRHVPGQ
jgi:hypothetical protein